MEMGYQYKFGDIVVLSSDLLPCFGLIKDIVIYDGIYYLTCNVLETECFCHHNHSYEVTYQFPSVISFCNINELYDYHHLGLYESNSRFFVPLKYHIIESLS